MSELQVFRSDQFGQIRTASRNGEPLFALKDVCETFGETNYRRVSARLDEDEKGVSQIYTPGGTQNMTVVTEAGLYSALFALQPTKARGVSDDYIEKRCAELKAFKRWVTHEVIPAIRKHGVYMTPSALEAALNDPDAMITVLTALKGEREARRALEAKAEADKPKVLFADAVSAAKTSILVGELAKLLKQNGVDIGQNRLFDWLRSNGYLIRRQGTDFNMPTQRAMELGLFEIKETVISHSDGHTSVNKTPKVTGKGQQYFVERFLGSGVAL